MTKNILELFYDHGGYESDSAYSAQDNYISADDVTGTYVPTAITRFNSMCQLTRSYDTGSISVGNIMDDVIVAELALSIADSEYDKLHVDPETYEIENKHMMVAMQYMKDVYGIPYKGTIVLPYQYTSYTSSNNSILVADLSD